MVTKTPAESAALALNMGCDLNCGNTYLHVLNAYNQGLISEETVTEAAVRLFTTRFILGLFDKTEFDSIAYEKIECDEHIALADKATLESVVLLKNDGILPINKESVKTIGVIGPNANSRAALIGNYHGTSSEYVTVLEGIKEAVGKDVRILFSEGCHLFEDKTEPLAIKGDRLAEAKIVAEHSDLVVHCVGLDETLEGEEGDSGNSYASGDKESLLLPKSQQRLLEAVAETGKPVVMLMMTGSAMDMRFANEHYNAILQTWYPGARGGRSIAKLLFGEVSPSGKLPVTFYDNLTEMPEFTDYSMKGRTYRYMDYKAQYPFGFGLTYGDVSVEQAEIVNCNNGDLDDTKTACIVKAVVQNSGRMETDDVVQVYIKNEDCIFAVPNPSLCGVQRIHLKAGEKKEVKIPVQRRAFTVVNENGERFLEGKSYRLYIGTNQPDAKSIELTGKKPIELHIEW